ncbi:hypothetical protein MLD38_020103 [Melastoma candidum]|uniref:Uncharacterized protein n=1 Tax=Melastoma candidum TaxID=119954 RepID=A0ACB9QCU0_9MYRT|nr:hypothetical protein MLD38_020103 [Melastoma candidum]
MATNENLPPIVIKQLAKELKNLDDSPPEGIEVAVNDDNFSTIYADIEGPAGTPYENGLFRMKLILSQDFPQSPPKGYFLTKIFHPNIALNGEICVNTLKKDWNPSLGLRHVLVVVRCLLIEPFPESALNEQAGKMLLENYDEYARHARLLTGIHAKLKPKIKSVKALISDQSNGVVQGQKNSAPPLPLTSNMAPVTNKALTGPEQPIPTTEAAICGTTTLISSGLKKVSGLSQVQQNDKKKIDARKKSLKRL